MTKPLKEQVAALRSQITLMSQSRVIDPDLTANLETDTSKTKAPVVANPTAGPHRMTFIVPSPDKTVFSLGQAGPADRIEETGITGKTNTHIHLHTVAKPAPSILVLGGPTNTATLKGFHGELVKENRGFMMVTDGNAWMDAKNQFYAVARESDMLLRVVKADQTVCVQADHGTAELIGGKTVTIASKASIAIGADSAMEVLDTEYDKPHTIQHSDPLMSKIVKGVMTVRDFEIAWGAFVKSLPSQTFSPKNLKKAWDTGNSDSKVKMALDAAKLASTFLRECDAWLKLSKKVGVPKIGVYSQGFVSITGDIAAGMYGNLSASITSLLSASVLGTTASMKGLLYASVWAQKEVSVKSKNHVKLDAEEGKGAFKSKQEMSIASTKNTVIVQGELDVRLNSVTGSSFVAGNKGAFLIAGSGAGYGYGATGDKLFFGKLTSDPGAFDAAPKVDAKQGVEIKSDSIRLTHNTAELSLKNDSITLQAKKGYHVKVTKSGKVKVESPKIFLG